MGIRIPGSQPVLGLLAGLALLGVPRRRRDPRAALDPAVLRAIFRPDVN